jgi:hypothetical protein
MLAPEICYNIGFTHFKGCDGLGEIKGNRTVLANNASLSLQAIASSVSHTA